jgi:hypothetical protein
MRSLLLVLVTIAACADSHGPPTAPRGTYCLATFRYVLTIHASAYRRELGNTEPVAGSRFCLRIHAAIDDSTRALIAAGRYAVWVTEVTGARYPVSLLYPDSLDGRIRRIGGAWWMEFYGERTGQWLPYVPHEWREPELRGAYGYADPYYAESLHVTWRRE